MRRFNLLNGTAMTLGAIAALGVASSAAAQTATAQAAVPPAADLVPQPGPTDQDVPPAPPMAGATPSPAPAAPGIKSAAGADSEIIVTARKRNEKLLDVPISIQAFSRTEIKAGGIDDLQALKSRSGFQLPTVLSTAPTGRYQGTIIFRGLNASLFGAARDNSGSLFVDGIFISGGQQSVNTADVERIEVLKGPQNAYFGRSTFGGAVNFITRNPREEFGGEINARGTARGSFDVDASVEGALLPGLVTARLTGVVHHRAPQYRATDGGPLGEENTQQITGTLYVTPMPDLWFRLRGTYQRDDDSTGVVAFLPANALAAGACTGEVPRGFNGRNGAALTAFGRNYFCNGIPNIDNAGPTPITSNTDIPAPFLAALRSNSANVPFFGGNLPDLDHSGFRRNAVRLSAQSGYTFDSGAALAFNVGYNRQKSQAIYDIDRTDARLFLNSRSFRTSDLTADGRFTTDPSKRIRVLLGASYFYARYQEGQAAYNYTTTATTSNGVIDNTRAHVPAVYGSLDFDLLQNVTLTGEGRYQWDKTTVKSATGIVTAEKTFRSFLPRVTLRFKPDTSTNIYASFSKGVQPAGPNAGYATLNAAQQAYVQSVYPGVSVFSLLPKLNDYEVGVKQRLFGGKVDYAIAVYQLDWKNAVTSSALFNPAACTTTVPPTVLTAACPLNTNGTTVSTPNNARIRGIEFSVTGRVSPQLTLDLTLDYKNAKWKRFALTGLNAIAGLTTVGDVYRGDGNRLARVPSLEGTFTATYRTPISTDWTGFTRGDIRYTGRAWDSELNVAKTEDFARVDLRAGIERENLILELFTTNLFNNRDYDFVARTVELSGNFTQPALIALPGARREIGLRTQFKF